MVETNAVIGVIDMAVNYENMVKSVKLILRRRYGLTVSDAEKAIEVSPLKNIFESDPEMAAHTSNEAWARDVYQYWKKL